MRERRVISDIMIEMLKCSAEEVDTIIRMVDLHGIEVVIYTASRSLKRRETT
jgi:hypothetical protein